MNTLLRAMIVDDEEPAREALVRMLTAFPYVRVVGEANSAATAVELFQDMKPDVIFLDVRMPRGDGFSILPKLEPIPAIVFVTAHDEFAVRAFEVNAVDYLLKPVSGQRLAQTLHRVLYEPRPEPSGRLRPDDQILLEGDGTMQMAYLAEITGIDAQGNYSRVHLKDSSSFLMRRSMAWWDARLPAPMFVRVTRSLFLNHRAIERVQVESRDRIRVQVAGFTFPEIVSRRGYERLRNALREPESR